MVDFGDQWNESDTFCLSQKTFTFLLANFFGIALHPRGDEWTDSEFLGMVVAGHHGVQRTAAYTLVRFWKCSC